MKFSMLKRIYKTLSKPINLAVLNAVFIAVIIAFNIYFQAFCIPTTWTIILLSICFSDMILYPLLETSRWAAVSSFINGISLMIFIYCVIFLEHINVLGLMFSLVGIGLVVFIPHFFVIQLLRKNYIRPARKSSRYFFLSGVFACIVAIVFIGHEYKMAMSSIEKFKASNYKELDKTFMTEKILGMHFIYHTRYCEYDGWRPPKHEPILVIGMWLNNRVDPLANVDLKTRLQLYKQFFPENQYKFDCSCGIEYNDDYHRDNLWK